jgi:hypothetical protein
MWGITFWATLVCGDINIDYLDENCHKRHQLGALHATYNLNSTVRFPTRTLNGSISAIDNIFIDISHNGKHSLYPPINGLSDHNSQIIQIENIHTHTQSSETRIICNFNKHHIQYFKTRLINEVWDSIFGENDVNEIFNNFQNTS